MMSYSDVLALDPPSIFPDTVTAGVTLRNMEVIPPYGLSLYRGEILTQEEVQWHREVLAKQLGIPLSSFVFQSQVHGAGIRIVHAGTAVGESDGMISSDSGCILCVSIADCAAVLLYDPVSHIIAALHSGWRGTVANITGKGVRMMCDAGAQSSTILAYVSACASGDRYEVKGDVAQLFPAAVVRQTGADQWLLDIRAQIMLQLQEAGVHHIEVSPACTIGDTRYHSFRRDGRASGRMMAWIGMK